MLRWRAFVPGRLLAYVTAARAIHDLAEKRPAWLTPAAGDWHIEGGTRYAFTVPVHQEAAAVIDSMFGQMPVDEDGDVSFTGWLSAADDHVGLHAGAVLVGCLSDNDAAVTRPEIQRRRRAVHADTFVAQDDRSVMAATVWLSPPVH
jgi:hypothetical protein